MDKEDESAVTVSGSSVYMQTTNQKLQIVIIHEINNQQLSGCISGMRKRLQIISIRIDILCDER